MSRRRIDDERVAMLTKAGWSARAIAEELGCGESTVTRSRVRAGVARPAAKFLTPEEVATIERLLDDGASLAEAARTIGRGPAGAVYQRFAGRAWTPQECGRLGMAVRWAGRPKR